MKTLSILILLGLISGCNDKETEIIELEPPITAVEQEVEQVSVAAEPTPIVELEPIEQAVEVVEEAVEVVEETETVEIVEETPQVL